MMSFPAITRHLATMTLAVLLTVSAAAEAQAPPVMRVTLLGTGTPLPLADRFGASTLVEAGADKLLFDCGRACSIRLFQKGITLRDVKLFITHLHSDHTSGIPDLWLTGWLPTLHGGDRSNKPLAVAGPDGTTHMMEHLRQAYIGDINIRTAQDRLTPITFEARDVAPGVVYEAGGVKVTAFEVDHGEHLKPAYGYRVDYGGRSVVLSGDTRFNQNVIEQGTGVDVLIHEVAMVRSLARAPMARDILAVHTSPQEAGRVFAAAKPRLAVYTHFGLAGRTGRNAATAADFEAATRETYAGPLEIGEDLMTIHIGEAITVERPGKM